MNAIRALAGLLMTSALAAAQPTGTLAGKVLNSATGKPVAGAAVVLQGLDPTGTPPQPDSYVLETGADGAFTVDNITAGRYELRAERAGYTAPPRGATAKPLRLAVEPGKAVRDVILKLIPLGSISGRLVDADGDPVSQSTVYAFGYSYATGKKVLKNLGYGNANDRGEFSIGNLPPGRCYLMYAPSAFSRRSLMGSLIKPLGPKNAFEFATTYYPAAADVAGAVALDLAPGGELRDKTIQLRPEQTYAIRATIAGPAAAGSTAMLSMGSSNGILGLEVHYGDTKTFPNSPAGTYEVRGEDRARNLSARQIVKLVNSDVDVTLTLHPEIVLNGTVRVAGGGKVALDGVRVSLDGGEWAPPSGATVQPDGSFVLRNLQPVTYQLRVKVPAGAYLQSVRLGERTLATPEIDIARASGSLVITVATGGAQLEGVTAEGASVVAIPAGRAGNWPDLVHSAEAGTDGKFQLRDLAPGDYQIFAFDDAEPGAPLDAEFRQPFEKLATTVHVAAGGHETVQLKAISATGAQ